MVVYVNNNTAISITGYIKTGSSICEVQLLYEYPLLPGQYASLMNLASRKDSCDLCPMELPTRGSRGSIDVVPSFAKA